jgi:hypothetical protein
MFSNFKEHMRLVEGKKKNGKSTAEDYLRAEKEN